MSSAYKTQSVLSRSLVKVKTHKAKYATAGKIQ